MLLPGNSPPTPQHLFSDHFSVICNLQQNKSSFPAKQIVYRDIKSIDINCLKSDLVSSRLCSDTPEGLEELTKCYNTTLAGTPEANGFNTHAPLKSKMVTARPRLPWFNQEINSALRMRRRAEKKWRRTNMASDLSEYKLIRNKVTFLLNKARCNFYKDFIESNSSDQRKLFKASKKLLGHSDDVLFPPFKDKMTLANDMGSFL